jgi:beta-galactosidase
VAKVNIRSKVQGENLSIKTIIRNAEGKIVAEKAVSDRFGDEIEQNIAVANPQLWSPETPYLYTAELQLYKGNILKDT